MTHRDAQAALHYHEATKHSEVKLRREAHRLDWANYPLPFKIYRGLESVPLIAERTALTEGTPAALDAIAPPIEAAKAAPPAERIPNLRVLSRVLFLAAGITKRRPIPGGEIGFRAYSNTGALYHIDLYVITADLPDLCAGVYHFGPHDFALHRLRTGDFRAVLAGASGGHAGVVRAPVVLVSASTYWRNAWKYTERAYRHCFWDGGTLHANLLAIGAAESLQPVVVMGFADSAVERLLGLDAAREGTLTLVPLGNTRATPPAPPSLEPLMLETEPLSRSEIDYPLIRRTHAAGSLSSGAEAAAWRAPFTSPRPPAASGALSPLSPRTAPDVSTDPLAEVILRRGSTRRFDPRQSITFAELSTVLDRASRGVAADFLDPPGTTLLDLHVIAHRVEGLAPGTYYYRRAERALELIQAGDFRQAAADLALGQILAGHAAANVYSMCALEPLLAHFGNRGYRAAQLEGGITAGWMYLAAYAQGFGATGLTFFDDEVTELFSPHAAGKGVMFLIALGHPDRAALVRRG